VPPEGRAHHAPLLLDFRILARVFQLFASKWQQSDVTGLFYGLGDNTLMFRARAGLAAWADIAFLGYIFSEKVGLFIVNRQSFICAELTKFGLGKEAAFAALLLSIVGSSIVSHLVLQFIFWFETSRVTFELLRT